MKPITIVLTEGYSDWEIAILAGAGRAFYGADIRFVSPDGGSLSSIAGLVIADTDRFDAPHGGVVVICGSSAFEQDVPEISAQLKKAREAGCIIAAICGGTIALARAGMLDDVEHTSNGPGYLQQHVADYAGSDVYVDQPKAIRAGNIITAPAPAPASFAAEVLAGGGPRSTESPGVTKHARQRILGLKLECCMHVAKNAPLCIYQVFCTNPTDPAREIASAGKKTADSYVPMSIKH